MHKQTITETRSSLCLDMLNGNATQFWHFILSRLRGASYAGFLIPRDSNRKRCKVEVVGPKYLLADLSSNGSERCRPDQSASVVSLLEPFV